MSVEEFLNWDSGDALKYELVDGEPRAMAPANRTHGILQGRLATLINNHLDRERRPCSLVVEPGVVPRLLPDHNVRVPDLAVVAARGEQAGHGELVEAAGVRARRLLRGDGAVPVPHS